MLHRYVVGFLFDDLLDEVALIRKNKPPWQAGKLNGVGGHIDDTDDLPFDAMCREFFEETGVGFREWHLFQVERFYSGAEVFFFYGVSTWHIRLVKTVTEEEVRVVNLEAFPVEKTIANLMYLIPMAIAKHRLIDKDVLPVIPYV